MSDQNERSALLAMMGTVFGEMKKIDQHIVGSSPQLRPKSDEVKTMFEGVLRNPVLPTQPVQVIMPAPVVEQPLMGAVTTTTLPYVTQEEKQKENTIKTVNG